MVVVFETALFCASSGVCTYACAQMLQQRLAALKLRTRKLSLEEVLCDRMLCFVLFAAVGAVAGFAIDLRVLPLCIALSALLARKAPAYIECRKRRLLRMQCERGLDALADTVAMGVRAGLTFDTALELYCNKFHDVLAREMQGALVQWRSGIASREQALKALAERVGSRDLERFANSVVQAVRFGSPIAETLSVFSRDLRRSRRVALEQEVEKAPVKMLVPMGTCILPAMLILVMGPVLLQFMGMST